MHCTIEKVSQTIINTGKSDTFIFYQLKKSGRSEAIKYAINIAKTKDIVLILGKGNEKKQKLKDKEIYFNDIEETQKALKEKNEKLAV